MFLQVPVRCNGLARETNITESHPTYHPVVTTTSQPLSASMSMNNGDEEVQTVAPTSGCNPSEQMGPLHFPSSVQPIPPAVNLSSGDPAEQLVASLSICTVSDSHSDASAMINDNIALRYAWVERLYERLPNTIISRTWDFHGSDYEECYLLGCGTVWVH
jgi:hypothetical protein